ncbi:MAG: DUF2442 domain-containing protein [Bacteroidota bacterium]
MASLDQKNQEQPDYYYGQMDALDRLIYEEGLRIKHIYFDQELALMLLVLNNKKVMKRTISEFKRLASATEQQLNNFENDGIGIHWPDVDEDLGLRGFLEYELIHMDKPIVT